MDVIEAIQKRRSINFFETGKKIPEEKVRELLELSNLAPSSFNLQPWKVVVVTDPERKKVLRRCAMDQAKVEEASLVLIMVAEPGALEENVDKVLDSWQELGFMKPGMREAYKGMMKSLYGERDSPARKFFAVKNTSIFAMNLMIAAKGLGLETHPMDGFDEACVKLEFSIPGEAVIPMIVAVGDLRPGAELLPRAFRRPLEEFVRYESYQ